MQRIYRALLVSFTVIALLGAPCRAQAEPSAASTDRDWYGWQMFIVTGSSVTLTPLVLVTGGMGGVAPLGGLLLGNPIVHFAHGNVKKGFASFGLNLGGAVVGGAIGAGLGVRLDSREGDWIIYGGMIGGGLGMLVTNIIDATVLAYNPSEPSGYGMRSRPRQSISLLPTFNIEPGRASLGVMGTF